MSRFLSFFVLITKYNGETKCQNIDLILAVLIFFCPILCPLILVDEIVFWVLLLKSTVLFWRIDSWLLLQRTVNSRKIFGPTGSNEIKLIILLYISIRPKSIRVTVFSTSCTCYLIFLYSEIHVPLLPNYIILLEWKKDKDFCPRHFPYRFMLNIYKRWRLQDFAKGR